MPTEAMPVEGSEHRKLAAIMFTDMVGYSALAQTNEALALKLLDEHRQLLRPLFPKHAGQEIKTIGDAFLVEFHSALNAVRCAVEMQKVLAEYNLSSPETTKIQVRIGIHVGDVVHRENDVFGDGVNIAARIEPVAEPGGVCVTQQVYDQVHKKLDVEFLALGRGELKNIRVPVHLFRVALPWEKATAPRITRWAFRLKQKRMRRRALSVLVLLVFAGVGWRLLRPAVHVPKPEAAELFAQANALSSHSSSHLEDKANNAGVIDLLEKATRIDPQFAAAHAKLGLAYVIRLFLFAPEEKDLQEKAYLAIERAFQLNPNLAEAYEARARLLWTAFNHFPHQDAIRNFQQALRLNPDLDEAHHYLGLIYLHVGLIEEGRQEFREAIKLNPSNNGAQYRIGESYFYEGNYREALKVFDTIDPAFNPDLHAYQSAWAQFRLGQKEQAVLRIEKSLQDYPGDEGGLLASVRAMIHAAAGEANAAETAIQLASRRRDFGHFHHTEYNIACAYALMNDTDRAIEWFEKAVHEGFNCYPLFETDPSLASLRGLERFQSILADEQRRWEGYKASFSKEAAAGQRN
jgi:class 3 adenylate cyclase/Tfp pilus assembly protein PilF